MAWTTLWLLERQKRRELLIWHKLSIAETKQLSSPSVNSTSESRSPGWFAPHCIPISSDYHLYKMLWVFSLFFFFYMCCENIAKLSDFSQGLTTEFIANIHLIKCKLPQLTLIFLGEEKIYNPSPTVDTTSADIMQFTSPAKQWSCLLASEHTVKPCMRNNRQQRGGRTIYIPG